MALLDFDAEKHTAVGIRSAQEYAYKNTGYAFIETTTPLIITDGNGEYLLSAGSGHSLKCYLPGRGNPLVL